MRGFSVRCGKGFELADREWVVVFANLNMVQDFARTCAGIQFDLNDSLK